jgi:hypothetical protein
VSSGFELQQRARHKSRKGNEEGSRRNSDGDGVKATNKLAVCGEFEKPSQRSGIFHGKEEIRAVG